MNGKVIAGAAGIALCGGLALGMVHHTQAESTTTLNTEQVSFETSDHNDAARLHQEPAPAVQPRSLTTAIPPPAPEPAPVTVDNDERDTGQSQQRTRRSSGSSSSSWQRRRGSGSSGSSSSSWNRDSQYSSYYSNSRNKWKYRD